VTKTQIDALYTTARKLTFIHRPKTFLPRKILTFQNSIVDFETALANPYAAHWMINLNLLALETTLTLGFRLNCYEPKQPLPLLKMKYWEPMKFLTQKGKWVLEELHFLKTSHISDR
jgi:hypothetical protein